MQLNNLCHTPQETGFPVAASRFVNYTDFLKWYLSSIWNLCPTYCSLKKGARSKYVQIKINSAGTLTSDCNQWWVYSQILSSPENVRNLLVPVHTANC
jgi:hypothetical protein